MLDIAQAWLAGGDRVALATVVRVDGSAPRGVGAKMLIAARGSIVGSVSGGCVESGVVDEAAALFAGGAARIVRFGIDRAMMWDIGLSCGGEIDVLIEPLPDLALLRRCFAPGTKAALCSLLDGAGVPAAQKALVYADGTIVGSLGDSLVDAGLAAAAVDQIARGESKTRPIGGRDVFVDVAAPRDRLVIVGAVHIAACLCELAARAGFAVTVIDPRAALNNAERFPSAGALLVGWPEDELPKVVLDERAYVAILTHDEKFDDPSLTIALRAQPRYIGAIGSRKTNAARTKRLAATGLSREAIGRVHAPIGLDIGADTPEEIAVAILAEMIAVKHGHSGASLRDRTTASIHS